MRTKCSLHFIRLLTHSEFGAKGKILDHSWSPIFSDGWKSAERYFGRWSLLMCNWEILLFLYQPDKQVSKIIYCSLESCWQKLKNLIKRLYKQASRNNLPIFKSKTLHSKWAIQWNGQKCQYRLVWCLCDFHPPNVCRCR